MTNDIQKPHPRPLSIQDVSSVLLMSEDTIRELIAHGDLLTYRCKRRHRRYVSFDAISLFLRFRAPRYIEAALQLGVKNP